MILHVGARRCNQAVEAVRSELCAYRQQPTRPGCNIAYSKFLQDSCIACVFDTLKCEDPLFLLQLSMGIIRVNTSVKFAVLSPPASLGAQEIHSPMGLGGRRF